MYHYQSMWDVRQHPAVYGIFRDLHRTEELWVSIDRVALKPPVRPGQPDYDQPGFIHWDTDISQYPDIPFLLQGVLALEDTSADMGGFQCVPSIYRDQQSFLDERSKPSHNPGPRHRRPPDRQGPPGRRRPGYLEDDAAARKRQKLRAAPPAGPVRHHEPAAAGRGTARDPQATAHHFVVHLRAPGYPGFPR